MANEIEIVLTDHIGTGTRGQTVDHNQWIVMADGQHIGYIGKKPGSCLGAIVPMTADQRAAVLDALNEKLPNHASGVVTPPDFDDDYEEIKEEGETL